MPPIDNKTEIQQLRTDITNLSRSFGYHKHKGYDSEKLDSSDSRVKLIDQATIITDSTLSNHFYVNLTGNRTLANPTGPRPGQRIVFEFIQDATGSRTITLGSKFNAGSFTITLTLTASKRDFMEVIYSDVDDKFYIINFVKNY